MRHRSIRFLLLALFSLPFAAKGEAQSGLRDRIEEQLFTFGDCGVPLCLDLDNVHGNHFLPSLAEGNKAVFGFLTHAIGTAAGSVPLADDSSESEARAAAHAYANDYANAVYRAAKARGLLRVRPMPPTVRYHESDKPDEEDLLLAEAAAEAGGLEYIREEDGDGVG